VSELEQRMATLERQNRKLQFGLVAVVTVLVAAACVGAVTPQGIPDVIEAREFKVIDENGNATAGMHAQGIDVHDANGTLRAHMTADGFWVFDENFAMRTLVDYDGIQNWDENARLRAQMGAARSGTRNFPPTGDGYDYPAAVLLLDAEGNVIWQAPR